MTNLLSLAALRRTGALLCMLLGMLAAPVHAQSILTKPTEHAHDPNYRPENGYWSEGAPRWFVSTKTELGTVYTKPYFSFGYGLPHWIWAGVDVNAIITTSFADVYGGVRLASPIFDVAFAVRDTWSFDKPFLMPRESYTRSQVLDAPGDKARYLVLELEAQAVLPLPHAALVGDFVMVDTLDLPDGMYMYEENYRLITKNPLFFVMRTAAVARFLPENSMILGLLAEYGWNTGREQGVWRVGPIMSLQVTDHLALNLGATLKVSSPDHLGLTLGAYGLAGFRYTWATRERRPELPWQGDLIPLGIGH